MKRSNASASGSGTGSRDAGRPRSLAVLAVCGAMAVACDYTRPNQVFVPDEDVVAIASVITEGFDRATLLATYTHRDSTSPPPVVDARLSGPGWTVDFVLPGPHVPDSLALLACNVNQESVPWKGPAVCLRARLPGPIEVGDRYTLSGTSELGAFHGETVVPPAPALVEPADTFVATPAADTFGVDLRYAAPVGVGFVVAEAANAVQVVVDSTGKTREEPRWLKYINPRELNPAADSVHVTVVSYTRSSPRNFWRPPEFRFDLYLVGFEENFSRFAGLRYDRLVIRPWPSFGISGDEGIYGYFGAASRSNPVHVIVRPK